MLSLGKAIKFVRTAQEMRLADVAKKAGIGTPFLSLVESEDRQPSIETLRKIAAALGVPSEALIILACPSSVTLRSKDRLVADLNKSLRRLDKAERDLRKRLKEKALERS